MSREFPNCWEIMNCGRQKGGVRESENGECPASRMGMGHSCWAVAGSFNEGRPFCPRTEQQGEHCSNCEVFKRYRRGRESQGKDIEEHFPEEEAKYRELMSGRWRSANRS